MPSILLSDSRQSIFKTLYFQVLLGIALGVLVGVVWPATGAAMRPLGDGFIKLIRMLIGPIIFTTITVGIAQMGQMKDVSRIGLRALLYFEAVSTLALVIGLVVVNVLQPGVGLHVTASEADIKAAASYGAAAAHRPGTVDFLLNIIPTTVADAFARGDILQVLLVSTLTGIALLSLGERAQPLVSVIDQLSPDAVRHRGDRHARRADRRVRRDGVHRRPLRHRHAVLARQADGRAST